MKERARNILIVALLIVPYILSAQQHTEDYYIRKINLRVLDKISQYEDKSSFSNADNYYNFKRLFETEDVKIFNDVMPDNNLDQKVGLEEYLNLIAKYYDKALKVEVNVLEITPINFESKYSGTVEVYAQKIVSGISKLGINYNDTFNIAINFKVNYKENKYDITDINSTEIRGKYVVIAAKKKTLFKLQPMINDTIWLNQKEIELDNKGYYLLKNIKPGEVYTLKSRDENIPGEKYITDNQLGKTFQSGIDKNVVNVGFREPLFIAQLSYGLMPFNVSPVIFKGGEYDAKLSNNFSYTAGIKIGAILHQNTRGYWRINSGFLFESFDYNIQVDQYTYSYKTKDEDQSEYKRTNIISNLKETHKLQYLSIPINIEKGFNFPSKSPYSIYISAGVNIMRLYKAQYTSKATGAYSGYYEDLFGITMSENGVYDFGVYNIANQEDLDARPILYCMEASTGISRKLGKSRRVSVNTGLNYKRSFQSIFNEKKYNLSDSFKELNSLTNLSDNYLINYFSINLGLSIKL